METKLMEVKSLSSLIIHEVIKKKFANVNLNATIQHL